MKSTRKPLVSIIVITYNSSSYVLETLESAKEQTYEKIELIVSDDGSSDDTVKICAAWLNENKGSFSNTLLITEKINSGISANCNRGVNAAKGEWLKLIAGDDKLLKDCITDNIKYVCSNPRVDICHSKSKVYSEYFSEDNLIRIAPRKNVFNSDVIDAKDQFKLLRLGCPIEATTVFFRTSLIKSVNGFDEEYEIDDWPLWMKITATGSKIYFNDKITTCYRIRSSSITRLQKAEKRIGTFYKKKEKIVRNFLWSKMPFDERIYYTYEFARLDFISSTDFSKSYFFNRCIQLFSFAPSYIYLKIKYLLMEIRFK